VLTTTDPAGRVTTNRYDPAGKLIAVLFGRCDALACPTRTTPPATRLDDRRHRHIHLTYDTFNEVVTQVQGAGATVS